MLTLLEKRTFGAREFFETREGVCRLMPPLAKVLAEMGPHLARVAAPVVEQAAQRLADRQGTVTKPLTVPTLLSQASRSAGRDGVRVKLQREVKPELVVSRACRACGVVFERQGRGHCDDCMSEDVRRARWPSAKKAGSGSRRCGHLRSAPTPERSVISHQ